MTRPSPGERTSLEDVDLSDARLYSHGDPHLVWQTLRDHAPLFWNGDGPGPAFWAVTRHADVRRVLRDHETFTSERGTVLWMLGVPEPASGKMMAVTDPPRHGRIREPLGRPLASRSMPGLEAAVASRVEEAFADLPEGEWDLAEAVRLLPVGIITDLMGLPAGDVATLADWCYASIAPLDPIYRRGPMGATLLWAHHELMDYFTQAVVARRTNPGHDLIDHLLTMDVGGRHLSDEEVVVNCYSLLLGGSVTTSQAITVGTLALVAQSGGRLEWRRTGVAEEIADEALRWASPTMHFMRYATRDVELHGRRIAAGDAVVAWIASANRDAAVFDDPFTFRKGRPPNRHVAFGSGMHLCVGRPLALLTLRLAFQALMDRTSAVELVGSVEHLVSSAAAGITRAPVSLSGVRDPVV